MLIGISGSGKSTLARQFCRTHPDYLRINRDDLRRSLLTISLEEYNKTWSRNEQSRIEQLVTILQETAILNGLAQGWNILIDNTNLHRRYIDAFRQLLTRHTEPVELTYQLVDTPLTECIKRDKYRDDTVGEGVVRRQARQLTALRQELTLAPELISPGASVL
ncbi:hypothetical protein GCM10027578_25960 [Spirosoma luteolum]